MEEIAFTNLLNQICLFTGRDRIIDFFTKSGFYLICANLRLIVNHLQELVNLTDKGEVYAQTYLCQKLVFHSPRNESIGFYELNQSKISFLKQMRLLPFSSIFVNDSELSKVFSAVIDFCVIVMQLQNQWSVLPND